MRSKDPNIERAETLMREWGAKIDALVLQAESTGSHARAGYRRRVEELKAQRADAQARIEEFKIAGSDTWEAFRSGLEIAWRDLEAAVGELGRESPVAKAPGRPASHRAKPARAKIQATMPKAPARHRTVGR